MAIATDDVIRVWRAVLPREDIGPGTDFFSSGGTSLRAARIAASLSEECGRLVRVRTVFQHPTPAALAAAVNEQAAQATPTSSVLEARRPTDGSVPLGEQQKAIWFQERLNPSVRAYNCVTAVHVPTGLDPARLRAALRVVLGRHDILRTSFPVRDGLPVQVLDSRTDIEPQLSVHVDVDDVRLGRELVELGQTPFDPARPPLIRWVLYRNVERGGDLLIQLEHHFVHDGWSTWLILQEIAAHYRGADLPPGEQADYRTFASWQAEWLNSPEAAEQRLHWANLLRDPRDEVRFRKDADRPKVFSHRGATLTIPLGAGVDRALTALAAEVGTTPFAVLYTAFGLVMSSTTGAERFVLAASYRNRRPEFAWTVGMFVNVVGIPFPSRRGLSFRALARQTAALLAAGDDNQEIPLAAVVRELRPTPQVTRNPIFQVCFSLNDWPDQQLDFGDCVTDEIDYPGTGAKFDLDVVALPPGPGRPWRLMWRYYAEVLEESDVRRMAELLDALVIAFADDPDADLATVLESLPVPAGHPA